MNLWFIFGGLIALTAFGIYLDYKDHWWDIFGTTLSAISGIAAAVVLLILIICVVDIPKQIYHFKQQKQYIEAHTVSDPVENATITITKIELNDWLYGVQYKNSNWGNWTFYPDEVQELTPIE